MRAKPLWRCPQCERTFANANQSHSCGNLGPLEDHFLRCEPKVREIFDTLARAIRACGRVTVLPEKTRIAFHRRMSFIAVMTRKKYLIGHFVLARRIDHPRFTRVETFSPRNHLHAFRLDEVAEIDAEFRAWIAEAYAVGNQQHREEIR